MKKYILFSILTCTLNCYAFPPQPRKCPEASVIAKNATGIILAATDPFGLWTVAFANNSYDTLNTWTFIVGKISASNSDEAEKRATQIVNSLVYSDGPVRVPRMKRWECIYTNDSNYVTVTTSPSLDGTPLH